MEDKKVFSEVYEILKYLSSENYKKIPNYVIKIIEENKDENYNWKYDISKSLTEQNLSRDTVAVLSYINMEYLLNDEQKELMEKMHAQNEKKLELEKKEKYNPDNIFKNNPKPIIPQPEPIPQEKALIATKGGIFAKFIKKLKNIFHIK